MPHLMREGHSEVLPIWHHAKPTLMRCKMNRQALRRGGASWGNLAGHHQPKRMPARGLSRALAGDEETGLVRQQESILLVPDLQPCRVPPRPSTAPELFARPSTSG